MHDSSIQNVFDRISHDLICDPIGIVVILIIVKVRYVRYAWILGVFVLSCCLILLHTYLRTDGRTSSSFLLLLTGWIGRGRRKEEKRKERWRRTLHLPGGLLLGYVSTPSSYLLFPGRESGDIPPTQKKEKEKKIRTDKNTIYFSFPIPEISRSRPRPRQPTSKPCSSQRISPRTRNQILDVRTSRCGSFCGNSSCCETSR